ncbi:MAG TPA: TonB family protein [Proteobacteria bacterium]|nr:TonB family protein [Pseudomonadota bacterium]
MPERKEPHYLLIFVILSLLLHCALVFSLRDWQPALKAMQALREKEKKEIPVQIIELPPQKEPEAVEPPPKPSFLADRNLKTEAESRSKESPVSSPAPTPKPAPQPRPQKAAPKVPVHKPEVPAAETATRLPDQPQETLAQKPKPAPTPKTEPRRETEKPLPEIKKLFPSFEELTRFNEEQSLEKSQPDGRQQPRLPNRLKETRELSLNTLDYKFHSYYLALKRKIELVWEYPFAARQAGVQGHLLIRFVINKNGSLAEVTVLRSSGVDLLDSEAVRAVRNAAPFPPLPARMESETLTITATFEYLLSYRSVY